MHKDHRTFIHEKEDVYVFVLCGEPITRDDLIDFNLAGYIYVEWEQNVYDEYDIGDGVFYGSYIDKHYFRKIVQP